MKTLNFQNNRLVLKNGSLNAVTGAEALRQRLVARLKLWRGEWFLNRPAGIPYATHVFGRGNRGDSSLQVDVTSIFNTEILKEQEVNSIIKSQGKLSSAERKYSYQAELDTVYGKIKVEV